jgi:hypothetical protein
MKRNPKGQFAAEPKYCPSRKEKRLSAGVADLKRFFLDGKTDEDIANRYGKTELVALLRFNQNRIKDDRK